jgi:hypothetical protein
VVPLVFNAVGASAANASIVRDTVGPEAQPLSSTVAAVSVGIVSGVLLPALHDEEDVKAETGINVVRAGDGRFVDAQGTAESQLERVPRTCHAPGCPGQQRSLTGTPPTLHQEHHPAGQPRRRGDRTSKLVMRFRSPSPALFFSC